LKRSTLSLRRSFARPASPLKTRKNLRLEFLEPRAVLTADLGIEVVFAPDTPAEVMAAYEDLPHQEGFDNFTFNDVDRWTRTATNTTTLAQGDPTTIRWSVVPDGTPISGYNGEPAAPSNLRSWLAGIYGSNASSSAAADQPWFNVVKSVFDRWSAVSGVNYVYEAADDGVALSAQNGGVLNRRGDVRISGHYIDGPYNVLAYNFFPTVGDMVLDTGDSFFSNTASNSLRLRNTMAHELGHGLGLDHVTPVSGTKLMEPSISLGFDGPQADDILAVNRGYGDRLEKNGGNNTPATATSLGTGTTFSFDTLSIDDDSDVDWFQFTVGSGASLGLTLTPAGSTYTSNSGSFNSLTQSNLAFGVYGGTGSTLLTTVNATGAGLAESLSSFNLPGSGTYYVRVSGSANAAQMYRLSGTISNVVTTNAPEIAVLDGTTDIVDGTGSVNLGSGLIGSVVSKNFTIQNTGNAELTLGAVTVPTGFVLTQAPAVTVAAGASTTFTVGLDTAVAGTFGGSLSVANNDVDENPFNFALSGIVNLNTPVTAPEIEILDGTTVLVDGSSTVNFGSVAVGGTSTKTLTIRNLGTADLTLSQLVLPTRYSIAAGPGQTTLAPGESTTLTLALNTSTVGTFSGAMSLANNDANEGPFNFNVTGTVTAQTPTTAPEIEVRDGTTILVDGSSTLNFGSVAVGGTSSKTLTIRNVGTGNLNLSQIVLPNAYSLTAGPGSTIVAPGASTTITLSLNTAAAGTFTGALSLANNDANEGPFNLTLTGTVTATPTTPTAIFSDTFNRANGSYLGSTWTERAGNYSISNQGLVSSTSGASVATVNNVTAADVILSADVNIGTGTATRDTGLVARHSGSGVGSQYWAGIRYSNGQYSAEIWKAVNSSWTRLSTTAVTSGTAAIRFEVIGSSLGLFVNGTLATSAADTSLTSGRIGVSSTNSNTRLDNFVAARPVAPLVAAAQAPANVSTTWLAALDQLLAQWNQQRRNNN